MRVHRKEHLKPALATETGLSNSGPVAAVINRRRTHRSADRWPLRRSEPGRGFTSAEPLLVPGQPQGRLHYQKAHACCGSSRSSNTVNVCGTIRTGWPSQFQRSRRHLTQLRWRSSVGRRRVRARQHRRSIIAAAPACSDLFKTSEGSSALFDTANAADRLMRCARGVEERPRQRMDQWSRRLRNVEATGGDLRQLERLRQVRSTSCRAVDDDYVQGRRDGKQACARCRRRPLRLWP